MTDMPEFRAWADRAHRDSLRSPKKSKNPRFWCGNCHNHTTKNQKKKNGNKCWNCKMPFKVN